ncbi:MAG: hypothetical protein J0L57_11200 [Burkholderiales bacterium]|nr:hypothetical protein [Burkholderiales bacterium]
MARDGAWQVVPATPEQIAAVAAHCRRLVSRRALLAAGVAVVPVPGLDWLTDVGILLKLLPDINRAFGLTPEQIEHLAPDRKVVVFKAVSAGGAMVVGRVVTRELVMNLLRVLGVRLTTQQAAKYVPVAGQAVSAALTYGALKWICEQHIKQCIAICEQLKLPAPTGVVG